MSERYFLDPAEVADPGRTEIELTDDSGAIRIATDGPQMGEASVESYMAEGEFGATVIDRSYPNRALEVPLVILDTEALPFDDARRQVQAWVGLVQETGRGWIGRETANGTLYYDVVRATLRLGSDNLQAWGYVDANAALVLEVNPDGHKAEQLLGSGTITGSGVIALDGVPGDYPARMRAVIRDGSGNAQRSLLYAVRPANTDPTAAIAYDATALTRFGGSARSDHVAFSALPPTWVAVLSSDVSGVGKMSHVGPHRVWTLFETAAPMQVRLEWASGSSAAFQPNRIVSLPTGATWVDLGEVQLDPAAAGSQQWEGRWLANGTALRIYRVRIVPTAYASGYVNASTVVPTASSVGAWDDFDSHSAGTLDGKTAPAGGTWSGAGSGSAIAVGSGVASWSGSTGSRFAVLLGTSLGFTDMRAIVGASAIPGTGENASAATSLVARYVDANNWVVGSVHVSRLRGGAVRYYRLLITVCVAGVATTSATSDRAEVFSSGRELRFVVSGGSALLYLDNVLELAISSAALGTSGVLARGSPGVQAEASRTGLVGGSSSTWDNLYVATPSASAVDDAVVHPRQAAELATDGYSRADAAGAAYARLAPIGSLPRCPVGDAELYVQVARSIIGQPLPSTTGDRTTVEVYGRPCYQFTA